MILLSNLQNFAKTVPATCTPSNGDFFGIPTWHKYLKGVETLSNGAPDCVIKITKINDFWLVVAALIDILLRLAALGAIAMIVYAGIMFITGEGQPDKVKKAIGIAINAAIGLTIAIGSAATISFIAGRFN